MRLAAFVFIVQMMLWIFRGHFAAALGLLMPLVMALCSSLFYAGVMWVIYMSIEPFIRRRWPQGIIGWSNVLTGHWNDPVVGRDVLFGVALGAFWLLDARVGDWARMLRGAPLNVGSTAFLDGMRPALGQMLTAIPTSVRSALVFFFLLFVLRMILRNQWLAVAAFVGLFVAIGLPGSHYPGIDLFEIVVTYGLAAIVLTRLGLLAGVAGLFVHDALLNLPVTLNPSAPYFTESMFIMTIVLAFCLWAFRTSFGNVKLWRADLLDSI
jgi:hypothetical protein